jgi:hypothetical protein
VVQGGLSAESPTWSEAKGIPLFTVVITKIYEDLFKQILKSLGGNSRTGSIPDNGTTYMYSQNQ